MRNQEVAKILYEIGTYLELEGAAFKPRAYEKAGHTIESLKENVQDIWLNGGLEALKNLPGVGASIAATIAEFLSEGKVEYYESLKQKYPIALTEISKIEGIGPKTALKLYRALQIKNIKDLEKAAKAGKIAKLQGFDPQKEKNILKGIEFLRKSSGRFLLGLLLPKARKLTKKLHGLAEVERAVIAGSTRRCKETVGDLDFLVISKNPKAVIDFFAAMPEVINIYAKGATKLSVKLENGIDADLRVIDPQSFGAALSYFTGSKYHNIALREIAIQKGYKLNEYGLFKTIAKKRGTAREKTQKEVMVAGRTEEEIYEKLGLAYIEPELRENQGEIEAAMKNALPNLVRITDIKGDLQTHTTWTDGNHSIKEMALAAKKLGYAYIAITDHTKALTVAGGLDEKKLLCQMAEIDKLNKALGGKPKILKGAEVNILQDGSLDIDDRVLAKLDICGAAVHSHFQISKREMTDRVKKAISNPHVDMLFHPTGRIINKRPGYEIEIKEILEHAKKTNTIVEINAHIDRLDLKDEHARMAVELKIPLAINTDSHDTEHLQYMEIGVAQARRGWAEASDIINTMPLTPFMKYLNNRP